MTEDLEQLRRAYREVKAPRHLAARIRARVAERPVERFAWKPVGAATMVAVAVAWLLPMMWQQQAQITPRPSKPSLSSLAALAPRKPSVGAPSLAKLRSVTVSKMPAKPQLRNSKPQSKYRNESELLEDRDNAYI